MRLLRLSCLLLAIAALHGCGDKPDVYNISIPDLKTTDDEAIVSFELSIHAGTIMEMTNVPFGWNISMDNNVGWYSRIVGKAEVGATSLAADEVKKMELVVRRNEAAGGTFDLSGDFIVARTFEKPRKISVTMKDFALN